MQTVPKLRRLILPAVWLLAVAPLCAQERLGGETGLARETSDLGSVLDAETGLVRSLTELVVEPMELREGWMELTSVVSEEPAVVVELGDRASEDGELRLRSPVADGAAMLCSGGRSWAVLCEQVFVQGQVWVAPDQPTDVAVRFESGLAVTGRYLLAGWPIAGARVAVVPAGIPFGRSFTLPLGLERSGAALQREVASDETGRFELPPLAVGEYFLETLLPSGRMHRSEPFLLPSPQAARRETTTDSSAVVVWDLGAIDVADGLVIAFEVADPEGRPLSDARVTGRQGTSPETLINFEATTDKEGRAALSGFSVDEAVHVSCRKPGYRVFRQDYALLPVLVTCVLEPLATVRGEVVGIDGAPPAGAMVSVKALAIESSTPDTGLPTRPAVEPAAVDAAGEFVLSELIAGDYELTAAAPGFEVAKRTFVVEPRQVLELEAIVLLYGREISGRVVDAESRTPLGGVEIRAVSPPGAALSLSDEDGEFSLATRSDDPLVLHLSREDYADRDVTVAVRQLEARKPLLFEMERGGRIRVIVWDEVADLPCQSCRLLIRPSASELFTDGYGEALSGFLAPGVYRVYKPRITHLGSSVIEEDEALSRTVRVRRGKTSTLRFGEGRRTVRVVFKPSPGAAWTLTARTSRRTERYRPEPGGGFHVKRRAGESLDLYLHLYDPAAKAEVEVRQATLPADFVAPEIVLPLRGAVLQGRVMSEAEPVAGVAVTLKGLHVVEGWAVARTRPDGAFSIPNLPPNVYTVFIGQRSIQIVSLRAGQTLDLATFDLTSGSF